MRIIADFDDGLSCPHCEKTYVIRWGKYKGHQKYKCKSCGNYFNDLTNIPT